MGSGGAWSEYLWRMCSWSPMDFQYTFSQMVMLCKAPNEVYKSTILRKQIKNQWARDDPAFVVVLFYFILVGSLAYSITFKVSSLWHFARIVAGSVLIEFLLCGVFMASLGRWYANKYLKVQRMMNVEQSVDWLYAFDIHCNGFFPLFVVLWPLQFVLSPLLLRPDFLCTLMANTLYALAFGYYYYITFLGYSALPFLQRTEKFLYPIAGVVACYLITLLFNVNLSRVVLSLYFPESADPSLPS